MAKRVATQQSVLQKASNAKFPQRVLDYLFGSQNVSSTEPSPRFELVDIAKVDASKLVAIVRVGETLLVLKYFLDGEEDFCKYIWDIYEKLKKESAPNILFPKQYEICPDGFYFIFPYIESASFPTSFPHLWFVLYEIARAIDACHKCGIIHTDIKKK